MATSLLQNNSQKTMDLDDIVSGKQTVKSEPSDDTQTNIYPWMNPLSFFAANPSATATAAALMASLPMQLRAQFASIGMHQHPAFFSGWPMTPPLSHKGGNSPPPPTSPISPALSHKSERSRKLNNNYSQTNNNHIVSTTSELLAHKKTNRRKQASVIHDTKDIDHAVPGSISPPTSSSSPQSTGSVELHIGSSTRDPTKDKVFTCKICNRSFGYKHVLQNHERTHTGEKPFECTQCHKRFTRDHHLKTHMRLHTGEKPYSCSHCDRQFVQVANLRRHLRVHTGERPYTCEICESRFSDSNQLKSHMLIHNGEKPFGCGQCQSRFRRRHHLMSHKCGNSVSDQTSHVSEASDESLDLAKTASQFRQQLLQGFQAKAASEEPLNLSNEVVPNEKLMSDFIQKFNQSKSRMIPKIDYVAMDLPEQTEPEDLSLRMHSPKSPVSMDELEELDDAATLIYKMQSKKHLL